MGLAPIITRKEVGLTVEFCFGNEDDAIRLASILVRNGHYVQLGPLFYPSGKFGIKVFDCHHYDKENDENGQQIP